MALQTTVTFVDDIDGSTDGVEHYTFSWLGDDYEIDLAPKSAQKLVDVMNTYTEKATLISKPRTTGGGRRRGSGASGTSTGKTQSVRAWAREQGMEVSDRGPGQSGCSGRLRPGPQ